jgi:hypothetical protein
MDREVFSSFAADRLGAVAYFPDDHRDEDAIFRTSLQSTLGLIGHVGQGQAAARTTGRVLAGYIDRMLPNAIADRFEGQHFIAMYQALLVTLAEFALFAFTQQGFFPEIGDARGEDSPTLAGGRAPGIVLLERTMTGAGVDPADAWRVPKDADRHATAIYLALLMVRFVWFHEYAHCHLGHVDSVQKQGIAPRLYEVPEPLAVAGFVQRTDRARVFAVLREMEFEADAAAFRACIDVQLADAENIEGIRAFDRETRVALTICGAWAMTWLFDEYQQFMATKGAGTHPEPIKRRERLVGHVSGSDGVFARAAANFNALAAVIPGMTPIGR